MGRLTALIGGLTRRINEKQWERRVAAEAKQPTALEILTYKKSDLRRDLIASIEAQKVETVGGVMGSVRISRPAYTAILGFFATEICLSNASRAGEIMHVTLREYDQLAQHSNGLYVLEEIKHKTLHAHGPAILTLNSQLYELLVTYVKYIRPQFANPDSPDAVFINNSGHALHPGSVSEYMAGLWANLHFPSNIGPTILRRTAVTALHSSRPSLKDVLSIKMNHRVTTAERDYRHNKKVDLAAAMGLHLQALNSVQEEDPQGELH